MKKSVNDTEIITITCAAGQFKLDTISKMRCLIIGGGGFIGSQLVVALLAQGHAVRVLDHNPDRGQLARSKVKLDTTRLEWVRAQFESHDAVVRALDGCSIAFHLLSTTVPKTSNDNSVWDVHSNLLPFIALLNQVRLTELKKIVFVSSGGTVYGVPRYLPIDEDHPTNPICSHGIVKLAMEKYLELYRHLYGLDYTILRVSNCYGVGQKTKSSQGVIAHFINRIMHDQPLEIWGNGSIVRDYVHISDVVAACLKILHYRGEEKIFNIGSGKPMTILDIVKELEDIIGKSITCNYFPQRAFDVPANILSIARAATSIDWSPTVAIDEGLRQVLNQCFKNHLIQPPF